MPFPSPGKQPVFQGFGKSPSSQSRKRDEPASEDTVRKARLEPVAKVEEVEAPSASDTADMPLWASTSLKAMQDFKLNVFLSPEVDLDLHLQVYALNIPVRLNASQAYVIIVDSKAEERAFVPGGRPADYQRLVKERGGVGIISEQGWLIKCLACRDIMSTDGFRYGET